MNILVLGNGFDLAHGLPTSYKDFLTFCKKLRHYINTAKPSLKANIKQKKLIRGK
ncbi:MAG: AbiH family protein [Coprococcus sp.]